jgi:hypothetical protein
MGDQLAGLLGSLEHSDADAVGARGEFRYSLAAAPSSNFRSRKANRRISLQCLGLFLPARYPEPN